MSPIDSLIVVGVVFFVIELSVSKPVQWWPRSTLSIAQIEWSEQLVRSPQGRWAGETCQTSETGLIFIHSTVAVLVLTQWTVSVVSEETVEKGELSRLKQLGYREYRAAQACSRLQFFLCRAFKAWLGSKENFNPELGSGSAWKDGQNHCQAWTGLKFLFLA